MKSCFKKTVSMFLCIAMLGSISLSVSAADISSSIDIPMEIETSISNDMLQQHFQAIDISDEASFVTDEIEETIIEQNTTALAENQPPVAALQVAVLNPESMINGKFTTKTQIAWLWSYNGENFTYDPDGDAIADIRIGGISNNDIIGTLTGNIGFATQFSTAGQYQLTFQVQDSQGAWSNIAKYGFSIEPADGNTRPVCRIGYSADNLVPNQIMLISWANSSDSDAGDRITSVGSIIYKDGTATSLNDYLVQNNGDSCYIKFTQTGSYEMWLRVSDSHNAWSDWVIFTVTVEPAVISDVSVGGTYEPTSKSAYWVDNFGAMAVDDGQIDSEGVKVLCEDFGSHDFPYSLPSKLVINSNFLSLAEF